MTQCGARIPASDGPGQWACQAPQGEHSHVLPPNAKAAPSASWSLPAGFLASVDANAFMVPL